MGPEEELKQINKAIKQYETVLRATTDADQRERVANELRKLKKYKAKIEAINIIDKGKLVENKSSDEYEDFPFLKGFLSEEDERSISDREVFYMSLYMNFFESEFLPFLSETKLKLDFKYSMERDSFYHRFQDLIRRLKDLMEESIRIEEGTFRVDIEEEMKKRIFKMKRSLSIELDRFMKDVEKFSADLLEDLEGDALKCLNGEDIVEFDPIEGKRYLEGFSVKDSLMKLESFASEVINFLDIPDLKIEG